VILPNKRILAGDDSLAPKYMYIADQVERIQMSRPGQDYNQHTSMRLQSKGYWTSIGLNGLAMRPIVLE
jgi:hypothetical protein